MYNKLFLCDTLRASSITGRRLQVADFNAALIAS